MFISALHQSAKKSDMSVTDYILAAFLEKGVSLEIIAGIASGRICLVREIPVNELSVIRRNLGKIL